jgi:hypothetical protein
VLVGKQRHEREVFIRQTWPNSAALRPLRFFPVTRPDRRSTPTLPLTTSPSRLLPIFAAIATVKKIEDTAIQQLCYFLRSLASYWRGLHTFFGLLAAVTFRRVSARLAAASLGLRSTNINDIHGISLDSCMLD